MLLVVLVLALFAATCEGGRLVIGNKARCTQCHTHKSKSAGSVWKEVLFVVKNKHDWKELESELYKVSLPDSPSYGQHWTKQQVDEYIRNDAGTNAVRAYLAKHDIKEIVEKSTSNGIYITAKASISTWETLLSASFHEYDNINDKGRSIHLADSFEMPDELEPYVETILKTVQFNGEVHKHGKINNRYGTNADLDANIFKGLGSSTKQKQLKNDVPFVNSRDYRERIKRESKATRRRQMTERIEKARSLRADFLNSPNYRKGMDVDAHLKRTLFDIDGKVTPAFLWYYLNVNVSSATGVGTTNTSMEVYEAIQQNYSPDDLKQFQQKFGAPIQPVSKYLGEGNYDQSSTCDNPNTADNCYEANLDIQYIMAVSWYTPAYYDYDNSDVPFVDWSIAMNERNDTDLATLTSISYGIPEKYMSDDQMSTFATEMIKLGLRGATVFNSAGDNGANGESQKTTCNNVEALPNFPSGCPYVVSVGATQGPEAGKKEVVCSTDNPQEYGGPSAITSGGGFSNFFARPWWQDTAVSEYFKNVPFQPKAGSYNTSGRGYPDISTLGNNYEIVVGGQVTGVDGTSCSSPVTTALFSIISGHRVAKGLPKLGWITPLLYYPVAAQTYFAHDITIGNNKCTESDSYYGSAHCCETGFYASSGWDPTTGIGSPKFAELYDYFIRLNFTSTNNTDHNNQTFPLDHVPTTGPTYAPTPAPTGGLTSAPTPEIITMSVEDMQVLEDFYNKLTGGQSALENWNFQRNSDNSYIYSACGNKTAPWKGIDCTTQEGKYFVSYMSLKEFNLSGTLTDKLPQMEYMDGFDFRQNSFSGAIPDIFGSSHIYNKNWQEALFSDNQFTSMPTDFSGLTKMMYFFADGNNMYMDKIPEGLASITSLEVLILNDNYFYEGTVPSQLQAARGLFGFECYNCNLKGSIPWDAFGSSVEYLILSDNELTGTISPDFGTTAQYLSYMFLDNNDLTGAIPASLTGDSLVNLDLAMNQFSGALSADIIEGATAMTYLNLSSNMLTGNLNDDSFHYYMFEALTTLDLSFNEFKGSIPANLYQASDLKYLTLSNNEFTGQLPSWAEAIKKDEMSNLAYLDVSSQFDIEGTVPVTYCQFKKLQELYIGGNDLTGDLPFGNENCTAMNPLLVFEALDQKFSFSSLNESFAAVRNLVALYLSIPDGSLPPSIQTLPNLTSINLASYPQANGPKLACVYNSDKCTNKASYEAGVGINVSEWQMPRLYDVRFLAGFEGAIPIGYNVSQLLSLVLSKETDIFYFLDGESNNYENGDNIILSNSNDNAFVGSIPPEIATENPNLRQLVLANNNFTGTVPATIGTLDDLTRLDLRNLIGINGQFDLCDLVTTNKTRVNIYGDTGITCLNSCWKDVTETRLENKNDDVLYGWTRDTANSTSGVKIIVSDGMDSCTSVHDTEMDALYDFCQAVNCQSRSDFSDWNFTKSSDGSYLHNACDWGSRYVGCSAADNVTHAQHIAYLWHDGWVGSGCNADYSYCTSYEWYPLVGTLSPSVANLTQLYTFFLGSELMNGTVDNSVMSMESLVEFTLFNCSFTGPLPYPNPVTDTHLLKKVSLADNDFTGTLPGAYFNLNFLERLELFNVPLYGAIASNKLCTSTLNLLDITGALFEPSNLDVALTDTNCPKLEVLSMTIPIRSDGNDGSVPTGLSSMTNLKELYMTASYQYFDDDTNGTSNPNDGQYELQNLPTSMGDYPPNLTGLGWIAGFTGAVGSISGLYDTYTSLDTLTVDIPKWYTMGKPLRNIVNNEVTGTIPESLGEDFDRLFWLDLANQNLTGTVPKTLKAAVNLTYIYLQSNNFEGDFDNCELINYKDSHNLLVNISDNANLCYRPCWSTYVQTTDVKWDWNTFSNSNNTVNVIIDSNQVMCEADVLANPYEQDVLRAFCDATDCLNNGAYYGKWNFSTDANGTYYSDPCADKWPFIECGYVNNTALHIFDIKPSYGYATDFNSWDHAEDQPKFIPLKGWLVPEIGNLTYLKRLELDGNFLTGTIPEQINKLVYLESLHLNNNLFTGSLPSLWPMPYLTWMNVQQNSLSGTIPIELISSNTKLKGLFLSANDFTGTLPTATSEHSSLEFIEAIDNDKLHGNLPGSWFALFTRLETLSFENCALTGSIPISDFDVTKSKLKWLYLMGNRLDATSLEDDLQKVTSLRGISITYPDGKVPSWVKDKKHDLEFYFMSTYSTIPGSYYSYLPNDLNDWDSKEQFKALGFMAGFNGSMPLNLGKFANLVALIFSPMYMSESLEGDMLLEKRGYVLNSYPNAIAGPIPSDIGTLSELTYLDFSENLLTGTVPETFKDLTNLTHLSFRNNAYKALNLYGTMADFLSGIYSQTHVLNLTLPGSVCWDLFKDMKNMETLDMTGMWLEPCPLSDTSRKNLDGSNYDGIWNALNPENNNWNETLQYLSLANANLGSSKAGLTVPEYLWQALPNLRGLDLSNNGLDWTIYVGKDNNGVSYLDKPIDNWGSAPLSRLEKLKIGANTFIVPTNSYGYAQSNFFLQASRLKYIDMSDNRISGQDVQVALGAGTTTTDGTALFDSVTDNFAQWEVLNLGCNQLQGSLLDDLWPGAAYTLRKFLINAPSISGNGAGTKLPETFLVNSQQLEIFDVMNFGFTSDNGQMDNTVFNGSWRSYLVQESMDQLILSGNQLSGTVPSGLISLIEVTNFRIDDNKFNQSFPNDPRWIGFESMQNFNISNNMFTGSLPSVVAELNGIENFLARGMVYASDYKGAANSFGGILDMCALTTTDRNFVDLRNDNKLTCFYPCWSDWVDSSSNIVDTPTKVAIPLSIDSTDAQLAICELPTNQTEMKFLKEFYDRMVSQSAFTSGITSAWNFTTSSDGTFLNNPCTEDWPGIQCGVLATADQTVYGISGLSFYNGSYLLGLPDDIGNYLTLSKFPLLDTFVVKDQTLLIGSIPSTIGSMEGLTTLTLSGTYFTGAFPSLTNLVSLRSLEMIMPSDNTFNGGDLSTAAPQLFYNGINSVIINYANLDGPIPITGLADRDAKYFGLKELDLCFNQLNGPFPEVLVTKNFASDTLSSMKLASNKFTGTLPSSIFGADNSLTSLVLRDNDFTGTLPSSLAKATGLDTLYLNANSFTGKIPDLSTLIQLSELGLFLNDDQTELPDLSMLTNLFWFELSNNAATAANKAFPTKIPKEAELMAFTNGFEGSVPSSLFTDYYDSIYVMAFSGLNVDFDTRIATGYKIKTGNTVTGGIPKDIYKEGSVLVGLFMPYCSLTGKIPVAADMSIGQFSGLSMLNLANNTLTGEIPNYLFADLTNLTHVYLNDNKFTGPLPTNLYDLTSALDISFADNVEINGPLLEDLCPLIYSNGYLVDLDVRNTKLSCVADCFKDIPNVSYYLHTDLNLTTNVCNDAIVEMDALENIYNVFGLSSLAAFNSGDGQWDFSKVNGTYAASACQSGNTSWTGLTCNDGNHISRVSLSDLSINAPLTKSFASFGELEELNLANNQLTGHLLEALTDLSALKTMNMSKNMLTGFLPSNLKALQALNFLYLDNNMFSGSLPGVDTGFDEMHALKMVFLQNNNFTGPISIYPQNAFSYDNLELLYLQNNQFTGAVDLCGLTRDSDAFIDVTGNQDLACYKMCWDDSGVNSTLERDSNLGDCMPTSMPTASPSSIPTTKPTSSPTTAAPSSIPTTKPTSIPTAAPSSNEAKDINFGADVVIVSPASVTEWTNNKEAYFSAIKAAIVATIGNTGITTDSIKEMSFQETGFPANCNADDGCPTLPTRRLSTVKDLDTVHLIRGGVSRRLTDTSILVSFRVVQNGVRGDTNTQIQKDLRTKQASGVFTSNLRAAAGSGQLSNAWVGAFDVDAGTATKGSGSTEFSEDDLIGTIVGCFFAVALSASFYYYFYHHKPKREASKAKLREQQERASASSGGAVLSPFQQWQNNQSSEASAMDDTRQASAADHPGGAGDAPTQSNPTKRTDRLSTEGATSTTKAGTRLSFNPFNFFGANGDSNTQDFIQNTDDVINPIAPDAPSNVSGPRASRGTTGGTLRTAKDTEGGLSDATGAQEYIRDDSVPDETFSRRGTAKYGGNVASVNTVTAEETGYDDL